MPNEAILSINGKRSAKVPLDDQQHSMFAQVGDYRVAVRVDGDVTIDVSHKGLVPCVVCGQKMMEVKLGHFACPGFYGSPMHFCDPVILSGGDPARKEEGERLARARVEKYCGCTLEEYLAARGQLMVEESTSTSSSYSTTDCWGEPPVTGKRR